jgi:hypothetical protein
MEHVGLPLDREEQNEAREQVNTPSARRRGKGDNLYVFGAGRSLMFRVPLSPSHHHHEPCANPDAILEEVPNARK